VNKKLKMKHEDKIKPLRETRGTEKKSLLQCNLELRNIMQSLKVGVAYVNLTALLLGGVILFCITGP
jgi:hypothetical protein